MNVRHAHPARNVTPVQISISRFSILLFVLLVYAISMSVSKFVPHVFSAAILAERADHDKPIHLEADRATVEDYKQRARFVPVHLPEMSY